jgi:hypothetical protein
MPRQGVDRFQIENGLPFREIHRAFPGKPRFAGFRCYGPAIRQGRSGIRRSIQWIHDEQARHAQAARRDGAAGMALTVVMPTPFCPTPMLSFRPDPAVSRLDGGDDDAAPTGPGFPDPVAHGSRPRKQPAETALVVDVRHAASRPFLSARDRSPGETPLRSARPVARVRGHGRTATMPERVRSGPVAAGFLERDLADRRGILSAGLNSKIFPANRIKGQAAARHPRK